MWHLSRANTDMMVKIELNLRETNVCMVVFAPNGQSDLRVIADLLIFSKTIFDGFLLMWSLPVATNKVFSVASLNGINEKRRDNEAIGRQVVFGRPIAQQSNTWGMGGRSRKIKFKVAALCNASTAEEDRVKKLAWEETGRLVFTTVTRCPFEAHQSANLPRPHARPRKNASTTYLRTQHPSTV